MTLLSFSPDIPLPIDASTERFAFLGRTGSGKTYGAMKLAEELLLVDAQIVVIDLAGRWYGIRVAGSGDGFQVPVFGGKHGDVPLDPGAGAFLARLVVERGTSAILDVSQFRKGEFRRFVTAFAEELFYLQKGLDDPRPLHLFLEEAHLVAPQKPSAADEPRMIGAITDLMREGRNHGIGMSVIDQRAASVNKDVLTQAECLLAFQTTSAQDRKSIKEWIDEHEAEGGAELAGIKRLQPGECFFYSPGWLRIFRKIKVGAKRTADVSATPKLGKKRAPPKPLTPVDLDGIRAAMQETVAKVEADDPKRLRARIVELERQVAAKPAPAPPTEKRVEVPVIDNGDLALLEKLLDRLEVVTSSAVEGQGHVRNALDSIRAEIARATLRKALAATPPPMAPRPVQRRADDRSPSASVPGDLKISAPQQRMIDTLAAFEAIGQSSLSRGNLAVHSGQSPRSSGYRANLSSVRAHGLAAIAGDDRVGLTDAGRKVAAASEVPASLAELHAAWRKQLSIPQAKMIDTLIEMYPKSAEWDYLALRSGQSPSSSGYRANLSTLSGLGLSCQPERRHFAATELLFPPGLS